jgi:SSS family solute:Na+ symporter
VIHGDELAVFIVLFLLVTVIGFLAARWRRGDLSTLSEWGLGGRRFGSVVTWFLLGGDLYTAYTFVAVPALIFAKGAIGLFALPYTIIVYPIVYVVMPKLWQVGRNLTRPRKRHHRARLPAHRRRVTQPSRSCLSVGCVSQIVEKRWVF